MLPVKSMDEVLSFPRSKWNIPEPPLTDDQGQEKPDGTYTGDIGVVIVPGVAFDPGCNRLAHGRGYYGELRKHCDTGPWISQKTFPFPTDSFLTRLKTSNEALEGPQIFTVVSHQK